MIRDSVWFIDRGAVNLFLVEFKNGVERAAPQHLMRRQAGRLLPGVAPGQPDKDDDTTLSLIAKGSPGTLLKRLPASLLSEIHPAELAEQIDTWLTAMTDTLSRFADRLPRPTALPNPASPGPWPPARYRCGRAWFGFRNRRAAPASTWTWSTRRILPRQAARRNP